MKRVITVLFAVTCLVYNNTHVEAQQPQKSAPSVGATGNKTAAVGVMKDLNQRLEEAIACEAARRGLPERDDVQDALKKARRQVLTQALRDDFLRSLPAPTEAELNAFYQRLKHQWVLPERYLIDAVPMAKLPPALQKQANALVTGNAVGDKQITPLLKNAVVSHTSGQWVMQQNLAPEIWNALAQMKIGEVRIIKTKVGDFCIRKCQHQPQTMLPLDSVRQQLAAIWQKEKLDAAWNAYLMKLQTNLLKQGR